MQVVRRSQLADMVGFFRAWLAEPRRVSAILLSSRALAWLITSETGPVIELGPWHRDFSPIFFWPAVWPRIH